MPATTIELIQERYCERRAALQASLRIDSATLAFIRRMMGWKWDNKEATREKMCAEAKAIKKAIEKGRPPPDTHCEHAPLVAPFVLQAAEANAVFKGHQKTQEREIARLVRTLPAYDWWHSVKGCGDLGLGIVVGEAGDLSNYANPGKLWKRLGLAPFQNGSQTFRAGSTWRMGGSASPKVRQEWTDGEKLTSEQWQEFGYVPRRRSAMFTLADAMIKSGDVYRQVYLDRKAYELERDPDMRKQKAHMRAHRYMIKRLVRDLWLNWTGADQGLTPSSPMPQGH